LWRTLPTLCVVTLCCCFLDALPCLLLFFFFTAPSTTAIYTLSLHDALPISDLLGHPECRPRLGPSCIESPVGQNFRNLFSGDSVDRKSTRLNSSHVSISYAVFCLKKKITNGTRPGQRRCHLGRRSSRHCYTQ